MFLKKRHHADIMARLHSNSDNNSNSKEIMEHYDDSGFSSDLIIDEDFEEDIESKRIEPEEPKMEEDKSLRMENISKRVSVIKYTCDLKRGMTDKKEKGNEKVLNEGCCSKMTSIKGECLKVSHI